MSQAISRRSADEDQAVGRMVAALAEIFGEAMSPDRLDGYVRALADVPVDALKLGLRLAAQACRFFPKPAEIRECVDAALAEQARRALADTVLAGPDERPWQTRPSCASCEDSGWIYPMGARYARRCPCYLSNPVLAKQREQKKYGKEARE